MEFRAPTDPLISPSEDHFRKVLDWSLLQFERRFYNIHFDMSLGDAKQRFQRLWGLLRDVLGDASPTPITEYLLLNWPREFVRVAEPGLWVHSIGPSNEDVSGGRTLLPSHVLRHWLARDDMDPDERLPTCRTQHVVVLTYFLAAHPAGPERLEDILSRRVFILDSANVWELDDDGFRYSRDVVETLSEIESPAVGGRYYQRLAIGFGCSSEAAADWVAKFARQLAGAVVVSWSTDIVENTAAAVQIGGWAHEVGKVSSALASLVGDETVSNEVRSTLRLCLAWIQMYTAVSRAGGMRRIEEAFQCIDSSTEDAVERLIAWAARMSCFAERMPGQNLEREALRRQRAVAMLFGDTIATRNLTCVHGDARIEAAFAQCVLAAVSNGLQHAVKIAEAPGSLIIAAVSERCLEVTNRVAAHAVRDDRGSGGTRAVLEMASTSLGSSEGLVFDAVAGPSYEPASDLLKTEIKKQWGDPPELWLTRVPLPDLWR